MAEINLKNINKKIPYPVIIFAFVTTITLGLYLIFSIVPGYRSMTKIRADIKTINEDLSVAKKIIPVFAKAKKYNIIKFEPKLPFPDRKKLDRVHLPGLLNKFQSLAIKHKLHLIDNELDARSLDWQSGSVSIRLKMQGQLRNFRNFIISIISLPFYGTMENISFHAGNNGLHHFSLNMKIDLEIKHE